MERIYQISGRVQPYAWGGKAFIADLLGQENSRKTPMAELWMGAHPKGPAEVIFSEGKKEPLDRLIERSPATILGTEVARKFQEQLPFLFKVLDVDDMLSIQCHPNKEQARVGFAREEAQGIPPDAPHRVFRDDNHKPELMVALTDFFLLHGFLPLKDIRQRIERTPEWYSLSKVAVGGIQPLYAHLMRLPQVEVNGLLLPLKQRLFGKPLDAYEKNSPDYWARKAFDTFDRPNGDLDRGIFSIYMMNIVSLKPGEAIFQDAGILHAYLEGVNVEIMANSDNVFRGGLTVKHIDVEQLLDHVQFTSVDPEVFTGNRVSEGVTSFPAPTPDFALHEVQLSQAYPTYEYKMDTPSIWLVLEGKVQFSGIEESLSRGSQALVCAGQRCSLRIDGNEKARLFRASVPEIE